MNVRIEILAPDELQQRLVFVPEWIQTVIDRAIKERRMIEYETLPTPFGTYPIRVRVWVEEEGHE